MIFSYKAKSKNGEVIEGVMESSDRYALSRELRGRGLVPLSVSHKKNNANAWRKKRKRRVKTSELILFSKSLSRMLKAGLSLSRSLSVLEKQAKNPFMKEILISMQSDIHTGSSLSQSLAKFPKVFSDFFVAMAKKGEETGTLEHALSNVEINLEKGRSLKGFIEDTLVYPGVIVSALVAIGISMLAFMVPTLAETFNKLGGELPVTTQAVIAGGEFFSQNLLLTFTILFSALFCLAALLKPKFAVKYTDYIALRLPMAGLVVREWHTARTARTMASLVLAGVSIAKAAEITKEEAPNIYYKQSLEEARALIARGASFSEALRESPRLYPAMMSDMTQVGEETGRLPAVLLEIAVFYESEVENKTKNISRVIDPILMVLIGGGVGFFAISMIYPLYSMLNSMN